MRDTSHHHMYWVIAGNVALLVLGAMTLAMTIVVMERPNSTDFLHALLQTL